MLVTGSLYNFKDEDIFDNNKQEKQSNCTSTMRIGTESKFQKDKRILVCTNAAYLGRPVPPTVHALIRSCKRFGIQIRLFSVDKEYHGFYLTNLVEQLKCLEGHVNDYDWVLSVDGFDSMIIRPLEDIFFETETMFFNTELNCYPDPNMKYPPCKTRFKYLNGGCFFAPMKLAVDCFRWHRPNIYNCNQYAWSFAYTTNALPITIDSECRIFQTLWGTTEKDFETVNGKLKNIETGSFPSVLHGNGSNYAHPILQRYW